MGHVEAIGGIAGSGMGAAGNVHHPGGGGALPVHQPRLGRVAEERRVHQLVAGHVGPVRGARVPVIHVVVGSGNLAHAAGVGPVHMEQRRVQLEGRHGHPLLVVVGAVYHLDSRVARDDIGTQAHLGGDEGQPPGRGPQPQQQHALVDFHHLDGAVLARLAEIRLQRNEVQRDKGEHHFLHLARRAQHAHIGAAVGHQGQVLEV